MPYLLNLAYLLLLVLLSPWLLYKSLTTGKYRRGMWSKVTGRGGPSPLTPHPSSTIWFHGVSVGEIHLLRPLVAAFRKRYPEWRCVVSSTTDTGYEEACKRFPDLHIIYWPLDFSWAVANALDTVRPDMIVLAEAELWPNFLGETKSRGIPVAVINGRMSPRSYRNWRWLQASPFAFVLRPFGWIDLWAVQTEEYAACFRNLGVPAGRIHVTGSIKYDGVEGDRDNPRTRQLQDLFKVAKGDLIWVAGSTQDPEERMALDIYRRLKAQQPTLRLFVVPRQKERFDEVAQLLKRSGAPFTRRSELQPSSQAGVEDIILVDTIGELGAVWGLADVAYVGGSLDGKRGGQNMIEPAAYGAAVVFGPHVWNFRDTARRLVEANAAIQINHAPELESIITMWLDDPTERARLGENAQRLVIQQQGATERTVDLLACLTSRTRHTQAA